MDNKTYTLHLNKIEITLILDALAVFRGVVRPITNVDTIVKLQEEIISIKTAGTSLMQNYLDIKFDEIKKLLGA